MNLPQQRIIGVDESGKGDFFGPLVIAACLVDSAREEQLREMGVRDGKQIANKKLQTIADQIQARFPHVVIVLRPKEYNQRYRAIGNLNKMLATGHADCIQGLLEDHAADRVISDKFGKPELIQDELHNRGVDIELAQLVRGEQYISVAAASILARSAFLDEMDSMSDKWGMEIPRGAAPLVDKAGRVFVKEHGQQALEHVAKIHFKNFKRVVSTTFV
jgi:ribonuclease HIII